MIPLTATVDDLKEAIKKQKTNDLSNADSNKLALWKWSIEVKDLDKDAGLHRPKALLSSQSIDDNTYIIVQLPQQDPRKRTLDNQELKYMPKNKRIRIIEGWKQYTASDGKVVDLPRTWIDHLKNDLQAGDAIIIPSMGQIPKNLGRDGQRNRLFVTEQMLDLWEDMCGDKDRTYRRTLSGPTGVGKSYLSYFLAARAYTEGWIVLYTPETEELCMFNENQLALQLVERFPSLNKGILTGSELELLVDDYDGSASISTKAVSRIFHDLLKSSARKTLLLVDEHWKLFEIKSNVPDTFKSLVPLKSHGWWGEHAKGSWAIFTTTAHPDFATTVLEESYKNRSAVFVGPLSKNVFSNLLDTCPRLATPAIRKKVLEITNCVPRVLVHLSGFVKCIPGPITEENLEDSSRDRARFFKVLDKKFYQDLESNGKKELYEALLHTFLYNTTNVDFE